MPDDFSNIDVLVLGGGHAALSAAITARENSTGVVMLECAPRHSRGGNSRHTRNMRLTHETQVDLYAGPYPEEEYWDDYMRVTGGSGNLELARMVIHESAGCLAWRIFEELARITSGTMTKAEISGYINSMDIYILGPVI